MEYQTSQFDYLFLLNIPIPIDIGQGQTVSIKTPSISEFYQDQDYRKLEALFLMQIDEIQESPQVYGFVANNYLELILGAKMVSEDGEIFSLLERISNIKITKKNITCNGVPLREEDILELRFAYLVSLGHMDINGKLKGKAGKESEDEFTRKMREAEEKIKGIRGATEEAEKKITFKEMLLFIMVELNKSHEELSKLNFYGLYELFEIAQRASYDKIQKIAAGNGNLPEGKGYKNILSD